MSELERNRDAAIEALSESQGAALGDEIRRWVTGINVGETRIEVRLDFSKLDQSLGRAEPISVTSPIQAIRCDDQMKLVLPPRTEAPAPNRALVKLVTRAMAARAQLIEGVPAQGVAEIEAILNSIQIDAASP